jgi:uracil-DNA glycosylase family 4
MHDNWQSLNRQIVACQRCPRLREHCRNVAAVRRKAYRDWNYWARPVPNLGAPNRRLLIVGLAPAAHGANRTGRMFTGDQSGIWLYRALHRAGWCNQEHSERTDDGLTLLNCAITAVCHCAPPDNKPRPDEIRHCRQYLERTWDLCRPRVILALGRIAWGETIGIAVRRQWLERRHSFAHGAVIGLSGKRHVVGCYHPSQQNTFTGRLTESMLDEVLHRARALSGLPAGRRGQNRGG